MNRPEFARLARLTLAPLALSLLPAGAAAPKKSSFEVTETTIAATEAALRAGQVSCRQIVEAYQSRIAAYDQTTHLNTVVVQNPEALADADALDREFAKTHVLRPLHCVAVVVKDNYDTKGLETTGGSLALRGFLPATDAFMVKRLRDAGAIVLFKSNMAEWAFSPVLTESSIAGVTRNAYDLERVPAGSSGGTASSVAASLGEVGLGTDTGDSIRGPASHLALVGIRPSIGLTSRDGIIPLNIMADVGGPLARSVADAAAVLSVVAGVDPADPVTQQAQGKIAPDYTKFLDAKGLKGARIGVFRRYSDAPATDPEIKALMERAIADMKAQGAEVVDFDIPDFATVTRRLGCSDFHKDLDDYFAAHGQGAQYHSLQEIVDSGLYLPSNATRLKGPLAPPGTGGAGGGAGAAAAAPSGTAPAAPTLAATIPAAAPAPCKDVYHDERRTAFRNAITGAMDAAKLDAIIYPTWSNPPRKVGDLKSPGGDNNQVLSPQSGMPAITVPMGFTHGTLPAGVTLLGRSFAEGELIKLAFSYEQATRWRKPPPLFGPLK